MFLPQWLNELASTDPVWMGMIQGKWAMMWKHSTASSVLGLMMMFGPAAVPLAHAKSESGSANTCRQIVDSSQRLACYDRVAAEEAATTTERQEKQFGLSEKQKSSEDRKEAENISAKIALIGGDSITLDNGMVWLLKDETRLLDWMRPGQEVNITHGVFGGYRLIVKGVNGRAVVERME